MRARLKDPPLDGRNGATVAVLLIARRRGNGRARRLPRCRSIACSCAATGWRRDDPAWAERDPSGKRRRGIGRGALRRRNLGRPRLGVQGRCGTQVVVHPGEQKQVFFRAVNRAGATTTGSATFNVTPTKAGIYFDKIQCFCFTEQTLQPGESPRYGGRLLCRSPVPERPEQRRNVRTITLVLYDVPQAAERRKPERRSLRSARSEFRRAPARSARLSRKAPRHERDARRRRCPRPSRQQARLSPRRPEPVAGSSARSSRAGWRRGAGLYMHGYGSVLLIHGVVGVLGVMAVVVARRDHSRPPSRATTRRSCNSGCCAMAWRSSSRPR